MYAEKRLFFFRHCISMVTQIIHANNFQYFLIGAFEHHLGRHASAPRFYPAISAQTPLIAWLQAREIPFRTWCRQIIAAAATEFKKSRRHHRADNVRADVIFIGFAAPVAEVSGYGLEGARNQRFAEYIFCEGKINLRHKIFTLKDVKIFRPRMQLYAQIKLKSR